MEAEMSEKQQVREKIAEIIADHYPDLIIIDTLAVADKILTLTMLAVLTENQELPSYKLPVNKQLSNNPWWSGYATGHIEAKEAMLKSGWRRCL